MANNVKDMVAHILFHVEAEARDQDPSQVGDVKARAEYIRSVLQGYELDARRLDKYTFLREVSRDAAANPLRESFRRMLSNLEVIDHATPQSAVQGWVARGTDFSDG